MTATRAVPGRPGQKQNRKMRHSRSAQAPQPARRVRALGPVHPYLDRLSRALAANGFSINPGGQVAYSALAFVAERPPHNLADEAICIYATSAARIDARP